MSAYTLGDPKNAKTLAIEDRYMVNCSLQRHNAVPYDNKNDLRAVVGVIVSDHTIKNRQREADLRLRKSQTPALNPVTK